MRQVRRQAEGQSQLIADDSHEPPQVMTPSRPREAERCRSTASASDPMRRRVLVHLDIVKMMERMAGSITSGAAGPAVSIAKRAPTRAARNRRAGGMECVCGENSTCSDLSKTSIRAVRHVSRK